MQVFDVGEGVTLPMEFSQQDVSSTAIWKYIFAAGLADAMSRTLTAPIDRLKTQLQVSSQHHDSNTYLGWG